MSKDKTIEIDYTDISVGQFDGNNHYIYLTSTADEEIIGRIYIGSDLPSSIYHLKKVISTLEEDLSYLQYKLDKQLVVKEKLKNDSKKSKTLNRKASRS